MRSLFGKKFRAVVLTLVFSASLVPAAAAAPREREQPSLRDEVVRIVRILKKKLGAPSTNADGLTTPRP